MGLFDKSFKKNSFHVGLGLHIYHLIPSKHILDILPQLGLTCPYNDIRQLSTALAKGDIDDKNDVYVPQNLEQVNEEKKNYIHASMDNFDLNEETIDGKCTTHSMAMVVFQKQQSLQSLGSIIKGGKYALSNEEADLVFQHILKYNKPKIRPQPSKFLSPTIKREEYKYTKKLNLVWRILRFFKKEDSFLGWTDFNNILSKNNIPLSIISYLPS
ncbi:hypothetical protein NQ314_010030 [Rhamnusium bicolor]|uniref:Homing endonuclease LAGLIDADG domain-containing protein n=1 Tax=Rhamnusium bicolor TaxID=1586634 RepID=A0AAV8XUR0_9CUCU|nr:hypothetical protein NQ314_010030 [Rhamnusium bicolor]